MTLIEFWRVEYQDEPFIMAYEASQVFYVVDIASKNWHVVFHGRKEVNNENDQANNEICEIESFTQIMINKYCNDIMDDALLTQKY